MFPPAEHPCAPSACDASALCVLSAAPEGFACLCPDGLVPIDETALRERRKCVIPHGVMRPAGEESTEGGGGACPLACGAGTCELRAGAARCRCPPLFAGERCQHYRCAQHCHRRGRCELDVPPDDLKHDTQRTEDREHDAQRTDDLEHDAPPPLKCICNAGYAGPRCEREADVCAAHSCSHGGTCRVRAGAAYCDCAPHYTGERCERCVDGERCEDICAVFCLNQGTCRVSAVGALSCACPAAWSGERCQRPACVDAACAAPHHTTSTNTSDTCGAGGACANGGHCVRTAAGARCACAGAWGGAACRRYVGHDHACAARACPPPALCVWGDDLSETEAGEVFCACLEGASCTPPVPSAAPEAGKGAGPAVAPGPGGGAWAGAALALLALLAAVLAALYLLHRRRHGAFVHARLSDNVEISNPMYLAGEDEHEPPEPPHARHNNGGNHFANPVYESMYAPPQGNPAEEHANLLRAGARAASPPPERAALL